VERYWEARWDYAEPYRQKIVPYPNVHLSFGAGRADVSGVCSGYQIKVLEGRGHVFGVAFRPGCFRPFLGASVSMITDRVVPATELSSIDGEREDMHILGYLVDHADPALLAALERFRADREARAGRMMDALRELGFELDTTAIDARIAAGAMHPAKAILEGQMQVYGDYQVAMRLPEMFGQQVLV